VALIGSLVIFSIYTQKLITFEETYNFNQAEEKTLNCYGLCNIKLNGIKLSDGSVFTDSLKIGENNIPIPTIEIQNYYSYIDKIYINISFDNTSALELELAVTDILNNRLYRNKTIILPRTVNEFIFDSKYYNINLYLGYQLILTPSFTGNCPKCINLKDEFQINLIFRIVAYSVSVIGVIRVLTYFIKIMCEKNTDVKKRKFIYKSNIEIELPLLKKSNLKKEEFKDQIPPIRDCVWDLTKSKTFFKNNGRITMNMNDTVAGTINPDNKLNINTFIWEMNSGYTTTMWLYYDDNTFDSIILSRGTPQPLTPVGSTDPPGYQIHIEIINNYVITFY